MITKRKHFISWVMVSAIGLMLVAETSAQPPQRKRRGRFSGQRPGMKTKSKASVKKSQIKPYDEVITKKAKSDAGLFLVHQLDEKVYYEIPTTQLDKDMLFVTQLEKTESGHSYAGMPVGNRVVRWELRGKNVLLRDIKYSTRADTKDTIAQAVKNSSVAPIIKVFPIKAWGKDKSPVIDVTSLFTSDVSEFSPKRSIGAGSLDSRRTFLESIKSFPGNIETKVLATYTPSRSSSTSQFPRRKPDPRRRRPQRRRPRTDSTQSGITVLVHHSMVKLPDHPMTPRRFDDRVGFFSVGFQDYADSSRHQVEDVKYITRWRLEKKNPQAKVSEVVKPIVFYVAREVPEKWKPYVKKGIELWKPAFEAAGFKNAIVGKYAPTKQEDPDWDAEDARISSIRWLPSTTENAFGPHIHDPRTGEILEADVRIYHNVTKLARDWYFVQASPNDKRAQKLPLPDDLVGQLLSYIVAHEVGHSIGYQHNMQGSSSYSVEQLRDPVFTKKNGTEASIMDYGRFNYVAQPGDGATLIPVVGPYDIFATKWGYSQFAKGKEKAGLAKLVALQKSNPMFRFGSADPREDPKRQTEDLGSDSIAATALGLKNIDRVAGYLVKACCNKGEDYTLLQNMYDRLVGQRYRELGHVTGVVAGFEKINLRYGDADTVYHTVDAAMQRKAVAFLNKHAFQTPMKLVDPRITMRLEADGATDRILSNQKRILSSLVSETKVKRMAELSNRDTTAYRPDEMLVDVRNGIFNELSGNNVTIDVYRRNLQRAYVDHLASFVKSSSSDSDMPALSRSELNTINQQIGRSLPKVNAKDVLTRAHLQDLKARIQKALDPKKSPASSDS